MLLLSLYRGEVSIWSWGAVGFEDFSLATAAAAAATVHIITIPATESGT